MDERFSVRDLVDDVQAAVDFYTGPLGFTLLHQDPPHFAQVVRGNLTLQLSGPTSSAGQPIPDGRIPEPGGWNRIQLAVDDLDATVHRLRAVGITFRNDTVQGRGGRQILLDDPAGNPVGLYEVGN